MKYLVFLFFLLLGNTFLLTSTGFTEGPNFVKLKNDYKIVTLEQVGDAKIIKNRLDNWRTKARKQTPILEHSKDPKISTLRNELLRKLDGVDVLKNQAKTIKIINKVINDGIQYKEDYKLYGKKDFWASPMQTIKNGGDCEDMALLKAVALYMLGFDRDKLHFAIGNVIYKGKKTVHAILAVQIGTDFYVLNNLSDQIQNFDRREFSPIYSVDQSEVTYFLKK